MLNVICPKCWQEQVKQSQPSLHTPQPQSQADIWLPPMDVHTSGPQNQADLITTDDCAHIATTKPSRFDYHRWLCTHRDHKTKQIWLPPMIVHISQPQSQADWVTAKYNCAHITTTKPSRFDYRQWLCTYHNHKTKQIWLPPMIVHTSQPQNQADLITIKYDCAHITTTKPSKLDYHWMQLCTHHNHKTK